MFIMNGIFKFLSEMECQLYSINRDGGLICIDLPTIICFSKHSHRRQDDKGNNYASAVKRALTWKFPDFLSYFTRLFLSSSVAAE